MRNKKKIIRACTVPQSIGFFEEVLERQREEGFETVVVSSPGVEFDEFRQRRPDVRTIEVPMERHISLWRDGVALLRMIRVFMKVRPYVVHSMTPKAGLLCMVAGWLTGVPVRIHTFTGLVWPTAVGVKRKILMMTDKILCACATHIIPEGEGVKNDLQAHITKKPMKVLGYGNARGVDMERFDPKRIAGVLDKNRKNPSADGETSSLLSDSACLSESELSTANQNHIAATCSSSPSSEVKNQKYLSSNITTPSARACSLSQSEVTERTPTSNPFTFLFVGRIVGDKGINELVEAFTRLHDKYGNTRLTLVGEYEKELDPVSELTQQRIAANSAIETPGAKGGDDLVREYMKADCFVFPSYREGFPNTPLEAGAMGLPSIVTDINGSREIVCCWNKDKNFFQLAQGPEEGDCKTKTEKTSYIDCDSSSSSANSMPECSNQDLAHQSQNHQTVCDANSQSTEDKKPVLSLKNHSLSSDSSEAKNQNDRICPNGIVIPSKDVDALYEAMELMLTDKDAYDRMKSNARPMIAERFEKSFVQGCQMRFYKEILG